MKRAFTLIELLISIALISIISVILTTLIIRYGIFYERQNVDIAANLDNRFILDDISAQVRQAAKIATSVTIDGQTFATSQTTIVLKLPALDQNGQTMQNIFDYVIFWQDSQDLKNFRKKIVPDLQSTRKVVSQILTSNLKSVVFSYNNPDPTQASTVTATLETIKTQGGQTKEAKDAVQVRLRNF